MKERRHIPRPLCSKFHRASELIGRRWTGAIIFMLMESRCRFATLRKEIPDITDRMLSERLFELEQEGIVERTVVPETPVRVEYALTRKGRELASAIDAIGDWAKKWIEAESPVAAAVRAGPRTRLELLRRKRAHGEDQRSDGKGMQLMPCIRNYVAP